MIPSRLVLFLNPPFYPYETILLSIILSYFSFHSALTEVPTPTTISPVPTSSLQTVRPPVPKSKFKSSKRERFPSLAPPITPKLKKIPTISDRKSLPRPSSKLGTLKVWHSAYQNVLFFSLHSFYVSFISYYSYILTRYLFSYPSFDIRSQNQHFLATNTPPNPTIWNPTEENEQHLYGAKRPVIWKC